MRRQRRQRRHEIINIYNSTKPPRLVSGRGQRQAKSGFKRLRESMFPSNFDQYLHYRLAVSSPELVMDRENVYSQKIDIWMMGLACLCMWSPLMAMDRCPRETEDYRMIMNDLIGDRRSNLSKIIRAMMMYSSTFAA